MKSLYTSVLRIGESLKKVPSRPSPTSAAALSVAEKAAWAAGPWGGCLVPLPTACWRTAWGEDTSEGAFCFFPTLPAPKQLTEHCWGKQLTQTIKPPAEKSADKCKQGFLPVRGISKGFSPQVDGVEIQIHLQLGGICCITSAV